MKNFPSEKELREIRKKLNKGPASRPLPPDASPSDGLKFKICSLFIVYKREHGISQDELAKKVGVHKSLMSKILHYHIDEFTTDRLLRFVSKIHPDVDVKIEVA